MRRASPPPRHTAVAPTSPQPSATIIIQTGSSPSPVPPPPPSNTIAESPSSSSSSPPPLVSTSQFSHASALRLAEEDAQQNKEISQIQQQLRREKVSRIKAVRSLKEQASRSRLLEEQLEILRKEMVCLREATKGKSQQQHQQQHERQDASARIRASEVSQALRKVSMERKKLRASERARETAERDAQEKTAECERLRNKLEQVLKRKRPQNHPKNHRSKQDRSFVERGADEKKPDVERSSIHVASVAREKHHNDAVSGYDIHGRRSEALTDALADAREWDAQVAQAHEIINKSEAERQTENKVEILPKKSRGSVRRVKKKPDHSLTLPSLSRQPRQDESTSVKELARGRDEKFHSNDDVFDQSNHERRLEEAYERLRNKQRVHQEGQIRNELAKTF